METETTIIRREPTNQQKIDEAVAEYTLALVENMNIKKREVKIKLDVEKSHYRLLRAKEELRAVESDLIK